MRRTLLLASKNPDKAKEIRTILQDVPLKIQSLTDYPDIVAPAETGRSFRENARIKAYYYYSECGIPVIADDSGLVVPALDGEPGVNSARYAAPTHDYKANNKKLLEKMAGLGSEDRAAYFVCYAVYYDGTEYVESEGRVNGIITNNERGKNGFGYDPVFLYPQLNKTFAELSANEKNNISHRKIAFDTLAIKLNKRLKSSQKKTPDLL